VEDRRVCRAGIFQALDLTGAERELDAVQECRAGIGFEVGVNQIRNLAGMPVQLDQIGSVDLAQVGPGAPVEVAGYSRSWYTLARCNVLCGQDSTVYTEHNCLGASNSARGNAIAPVTTAGAPVGKGEHESFSQICNEFHARRSFRRVVRPGVRH
jgi:hypothetical protein